MKSYILAIFGFLISWPITLSESTTFDQTYDESIDDLTEESEYDSSSSSQIEDADLSYDWPDEDDEENMNYILPDSQETSMDDSSSSSIEDEDLSYDSSDKDEDLENLNYDWSVLRETLDADFDDWTMSPENETMESLEMIKVSNSYKAVTKSNTGEIRIMIFQCICTLHN